METVVEGRPRWSRDQVLAHVSALLVEREGLEPAAITPESELEGDLGLDSLSQVELQMALEEAFGVDLEARPAASIRTVRDAVEAVLGAIAVAGR